MKPEPSGLFLPRGRESQRPPAFSGWLENAAESRLVEARITPQLQRNTQAQRCALADLLRRFCGANRLDAGVGLPLRSRNAQNHCNYFKYLAKLAKFHILEVSGLVHH